MSVLRYDELVDFLLFGLALALNDAAKCYHFRYHCGVSGFLCRVVCSLRLSAGLVLFPTDVVGSHHWYAELVFQHYGPLGLLSYGYDSKALWLNLAGGGHQHLELPSDRMRFYLDLLQCYLLCRQPYALAERLFFQ